MKGTFTVRGHKIRTQSHFRYQLVSVRENAVRTEDGTYVAFAHIFGRTDSLTSARERAAKVRDRNRGTSPGVVVVIVDSTTGEEVQG